MPGAPSLPRPGNQKGEGPYEPIVHVALHGQQQGVHEHALWPQQCPDGGDGSGGGLDACAVHSKVVPSATLMTVPTAISSPDTVGV